MKKKDSVDNMFFNVYLTIYIQKHHYKSISICIFDFIGKKKNLQEYLLLPVENAT